MAKLLTLLTFDGQVINSTAYIYSKKRENKREREREREKKKKKKQKKGGSGGRVLSTLKTVQPTSPEFAGVESLLPKFGRWTVKKHVFYQELSGTPNPRYFLKSNAGTNKRRTAVQMGGVLRRFLSSRLRSQEAQRYKGGRTAVQIGGVLPVPFQTSCTGWGFRNSAHFTVRFPVLPFLGVFFSLVFFSLRSSLVLLGVFR